MGNRAVITTAEKRIGLYLHWNGGRDTVEPLLKYCEPIYGHEAAWKLVLVLVVACSGMATLLMAFTWRLKPRA